MENTTEQEEKFEKNGETAVEGGPENTVEPAQKAEEQPAVDPLKKLQDELAEAKDKYLRLYAEFENHRRRTAKEKLEMIQGANEQLIKNMLPVLDDFERAQKAFSEKNDKESEGFLLIYNKMKKVMDQHGVSVMNAKGEFNPDLHEAITQVPGDAKMKGKIVDVVENGYLLKDKVIRFAKVVVGS